MYQSRCGDVGQIGVRVGKSAESCAHRYGRQIRTDLTESYKSLIEAPREYSQSNARDIEYIDSEEFDDAHMDEVAARNCLIWTPFWYRVALVNAEPRVKIAAIRYAREKSAVFGHLLGHAVGGD